MGEPPSLTVWHTIFSLNLQPYKCQRQLLKTTISVVLHRLLGSSIESDESRTNLWFPIKKNIVLSTPFVHISWIIVRYAQVWKIRFRAQTCAWNDYCSLVLAHPQKLKRLIETEKEQLQSSLNTHREEASDSHTCHNEAVKQCRETWLKIIDPEKKSDAENDTPELQHLNETFILVVCADYQQSKLIPYWGDLHSQAWCIICRKFLRYFWHYWLQKWPRVCVLSTRNNWSKNTDNTLSYLYHFLCESGQVPSWISPIHLFLDNACSMNKHYYMTAFFRSSCHRKSSASSDCLSW